MARPGVALWRGCESIDERATRVKWAKPQRPGFAGSVEVRRRKTGYIRASGYCLATCVREAGRELISIALGSPSNRARFDETNILLGRVKPDLSNQESVENIEVSPGG